MSDISSLVVPDHSVSTDSEESFLVKQINRSQLFNSSTTSSSNSSKKRRSFFRESYIDENGTDRSFNVYQDAIMENSDESRDISDISKLSNLDANKLHNINRSGSRGSILGDLTLNQVSDPLPDISRKSSHRRSKYDLQYQASPVPHSQRNSFILTSPNLANDSSNPLSVFKSPEIPAPAPPPPTAQRDTITDIISAYNEPDNQRSSNLSEHSQNTSTDALKSFKILSKPTRMDGSSSNSSSKTFHSIRSDMSSRRSLLSYEMTRKKQIGTPHLLINTQNHSTNSLTPNTQNSSSSDRPSIPSIPVPFFDQAERKAPEPTHLKEQPNQLRSPIPYKRGPDILRTLKIEQATKTLIDDSQSDQSSDIQFNEKQSLDLDKSKNTDNNTPPYSDELLEKIYYYRNQHEIIEPRKSDGLVWLIYFISFIVPPLFFFLGLGLLDRYLPRHQVSPNVKRLSLITGILVSIVSFAMIGVGFGYGIHEASLR